MEIVKRGIAAFNHRNVDVFATLVTPDFAWYPARPGVVEGDVYRGREGIEMYFERNRQHVGGAPVIGGEFRDLGDRLVVLGRTEGRGRGSGVQVDSPIGVIYDFRDGKMSRVLAYLDHGEALRAAGLSE